MLFLCFQLDFRGKFSPARAKNPSHFKRLREKYQKLEIDLTGSIHSDMPIMMPVQMPKFIADENRTREFAIGYDAFEIILLRYGPVNSKNFIYKGLTGKIKIDQLSKKIYSNRNN